MGSSLSCGAEGDCRFLVLLLRAKGVLQVEISRTTRIIVSFQGAYLVQLHAEEVLDLQEVAGRFQIEYGEKTRDTTRCKGCDVMHKSVR